MKELRIIFRTIEKYRMVEEGDVIYVAVSGGKDSAAALFGLCEYVKQHRINARIKAFHIDLSGGKAENVLKAVEKQAELCSAELRVFDVRKELGKDFIKKIRDSRRAVCSVCGVIKRYFMNKIPREEGAKKLATGHCASDFALFFLKNLAGKKFDWIAKFKPFLESEHVKLIAKIRPLFFTTEIETEKICKEYGIPFVKTEKCALLEELKCEHGKTTLLLKNCIKEIDVKNREFLRALVSGVEKLVSEIKPAEKEGEFKECRICGEPTSSEICAFCKIFKGAKQPNFS